MSKTREREERRYGSARERADKKSVSERGPYLKIPSGAKMFQPKTGVMLIDILPFVAGEGNPCAKEGVLWYERTFYVHRGIGANSETYLCPRKTNRHACPVCEMREKLMKKNDDDDEELIKDLAPKERQLFNVRNLKEPDKGVQLWDVSFHLFGKFLDQRIRNADEEDDWDTFFFAEGGKTLKLGFEEDSYGGRTFNKVATIDFRERKEDYDEDELLEEVHPLDELLVESSYKDMKKAFLQTADEDEEGDEDEDEKPKKKHREEEDEDDEPPRKKKKVVEEDEDEERPKKKHREEADEDEEPPRKKKHVEEDEDEEPPKKKKKVVEEDEDEEPPRKKKHVEEDEDDEPPKKKKKSEEQEEEDWDKFDAAEEDDEPPKKKKKVVDDD